MINRRSQKFLVAPPTRPVAPSEDHAGSQERERLGALQPRSTQYPHKYTTPSLSPRSSPSPPGSSAHRRSQRRHPGLQHHFRPPARHRAVAALEAPRECDCSTLERLPCNSTVGSAPALQRQCPLLTTTEHALQQLSTLHNSPPDLQQWWLLQMEIATMTMVAAGILVEWLSFCCSTTASRVATTAPTVASLL